MSLLTRWRKNLGSKLAIKHRVVNKTVWRTIGGTKVKQTIETFLNNQFVEIISEN